MYILFLLVILTGDLHTYGPGGETVQFPTLAACEAKQKEVRPALEQQGIGPFVLECRKV